MTKYIIVKKRGLETAILFYGVISHDEAVNPERLALNGSQVVSAGFFEIRDGVINISKEGSMKLNVEPRPQDVAIIEATILYMGFARLNWNPSQVIKAVSAFLNYSPN